jgi:hypothetical protein
MRVDDREGGLQVLKKLTGIVALGGDAVVDSKNYHD